MINSNALILISDRWRRPPTFRVITWFFCLLCLVGPVARGNANPVLESLQLNVLPDNRAQEDIDPQGLEPDQQVERVLSGGQRHFYKLALTSGQYARLVVEQKGIDVVVKLLQPDGKLIAEVDSPNGNQGPETVALIAEATGVYRLEVSSLEKDARPGRYEIKLLDLRSATEHDKYRMAASKALDEGKSLHLKATRDSLTAAIKKYEEALSLYRVAEDQSGQLIVLNHMTSAYILLGDAPRVLERLNQALQMAQSLGDKREQAHALERLATTYRNIGELARALTYSDDALRLYQTAGDRNKEAYMHTSLGGIYVFLGEYEKGREYFDRAMRLYQLLGDKYGEARTLHSVGYSYIMQDEAQSALDYYRRALALWQIIENRQQEGIEQSFVSNEYARMGKRQKALEHVALALRLRSAVRDFDEATVLTNVGHTYYKLGETQQALGYYNAALRIWQTLGDKRGEAITLKHISAVERDLGQLAEARLNIEKAIAQLEFMRDHAGNSEFQSSFVASLFEYYEFYIDLLMRLHAANPQAGNDLEALAFTEKVKVRGLVELLAQARVDLRRSVDGALLERERSINERITRGMDNLTKLLRGKYTDAQRVAAEGEIDALMSDYARVQAEIRERSPRYASLTRSQPLSVKEIQQQVLDGETVLLEYALGNEHSYLWVVTTDKVQSYQLPPKAEIEAQARLVYQLLIARQTVQGLTPAQQREREMEADAQYRNQALALSRMLLGPVYNQLGTKRLLIVADGALQYLPFAALPVPSIRESSAALQEPGKEPDLQPLIVEHEIVNLPSASVLALMRRELADRQPAARAIAVLADPVFEPDDARVKLRVATGLSNRQAPNQKSQPAPYAAASLTSTLEHALRSARSGSAYVGLRRLLFSRDEAEAILSVQPQTSDLKALDFQANRRLAMSDELKEYRIIHFSTHGLLDSLHPELSGLVLSLVDERGQPVEGFLRLHEIYNMRLNADMVVLSACRTGLGKEVRGEGLIGLVRGFMYAGAARIVASLWEVDDAATTSLMKRFYRGILQEKLSPAAALRAAQIEMFRKKHWQSPYYWGAFVLQGEWK